MYKQQADNSSMGLALWNMCWPLLASSCLVSSIGLVDLFLAGRMGEAAQAAVGIGEQVLCLTIIAGTGLATGTAAFVSRHVGGGNYALARLYAHDSLKASIAVGLAALIIGFALPGQIFEMFQTDPEVARVGTQYLQLCAFGSLPFVVSCCLGAIFRSFGSPKYCLYIWLLTAGISIGGSILLVAASWQWFTSSVTALAMAWDIGCLAGTLSGLFWLRKLPTAIAEPANDFGTVEVRNAGARPPRAMHGIAPTMFGRASGRLFDIAIVSIPAIVADGCWILANFLIFRILSVLPDATRAQAAWSIALKLEETFALMPLLALNLAAAVIVGQSLGAGNRARARMATWRMAGAGVSIMFVLGAGIALAAPLLASAMTSDPGISSWSIALLRAAPALLPLAALWLIVLGSLEGAGDTHLSMCCNLLGLICVQLPLTWLLVGVLGWGATGIWVGIATSRLFLSSAALWGFYRVSPALSTKDTGLTPRTSIMHYRKERGLPRLQGSRERSVLKVSRGNLCIDIAPDK